MQVSSVAESDNYAIVGGGQAREFKIAASAHTFRILSNSLYQDKEGAIVRETICNAYDAHVMAGIPDREIEITITENALTIKDFGPGIADEQMIPIYGTYFGSTKTTDDSQIGGFGLGCKAPFCLTDHFMVTSCHEGIKRTYAVTIGNDETNGKPACQTMATQKTTEQGLTVTIPIENNGMRYNFERAITKFLRLSGIKAKLNGETFKGGRDYTGIEEAGFGLFAYNGSGSEKSICVLYGKVLYPLNKHDDLTETIRNLHFHITNGGKMQLVLYAPPSSIEIQPSREGLSYDARTVKTIKGIAERAIRMVKARMGKATKDIILRTIEGHRRWRVYNAMSTLNSYHFTPADARYIGAQECAEYLARWNLAKRDHRISDQARRIVGNYYRDNRALLHADEYHLRRYCDPYLIDQRRYVLKKMARAVSGVKDGRLLARISGSARLQDAKLRIGEPWDNVGLTIAPTRVAALTTGKAGFFLISKEITPEQSAEIKRKMEMYGFTFGQVKDVRRNLTRSKVIKHDAAESTLFSPFEFKPTKISIRSSYTKYQELVDPSLAEPVAFLPLALSQRKVRKAPKKVQIGPMQPTFERTAICVTEGIPGLFEGLVGEGVAVPRSEAERDRLVEMGVPRLCEQILGDLKKRVKPRNANDAFTAYCALYCDDSNYYRWDDDAKPMRFAAALAKRGRRFACAVFMQPYRESKALDETYRLWKRARDFFKNNSVRGHWLDDGEYSLFDECKHEYENLLKEFDKQLPKEISAFLERIRDSKLTRDDVAHLKFISKVVDPDSIRRLDSSEIDQLIAMIEREGKSFIASEIPKQKAKLKMNQQPTDEDD